MEGSRQPAFYLILLLTVFITAANSLQDLKVHKASQCFKSRGIPKVQFDCEANSMIKIDRAFHGIKKTVDKQKQQPWESNCELSDAQESLNCSKCPGDCMDDSMNLVYDWSTCMGNRSCTRTVMQSYMPTCQGTNKKFSDFLQVEYQCVPKKQVYDICQYIEKEVQSGFIMSPNYPYNYPVNQDCMCTLSTSWDSRIVLSLVDLLLETKNSRCRADWMMLRQNNQKHRHCGAIMTGVKNITSTGNELAIQFHSDNNNNRTQKFQYFTRSLKGFWMSFTAEPRNQIRLQCKALASADKEVMEIAKDDAEYDEILSTRATETTTITTTESNEITVKDGGKDGPRRPPGKGNGRRRPPGSRQRNSQNERGQQGGSGRKDVDSGAPTAVFTLQVLLLSMLLHLLHKL